MTLKELRLSKGLTQKKAAEICSVSLRTYKTYENDISKETNSRYRYMRMALEEYGHVDETHGTLTVDQIREKCAAVFLGSKVLYCYLFGSYAKGYATETSDVDLLISGEVSGLQFFGLAESLRSTLCKKVDLLDMSQLVQNAELLNEILKDGIKIYG